MRRRMEELDIVHRDLINEMQVCCAPPVPRRVLRVLEFSLSTMFSCSPEPRARDTMGSRFVDAR